MGSRVVSGGSGVTATLLRLFGLGSRESTTLKGWLPCTATPNKPGGERRRWWRCMAVVVAVYGGGGGGNQQESEKGGL